MRDNLTAKKILSNIKPFFCYWLCCLIYLVLGFFEILSIQEAIVVSLIFYVVTGFLAGFSINNLKENIAGLAIYEFMLIICPLIPWATDFLRGISQFGNMFCEVIHPFLWGEVPVAGRYIFSVTFPIIIILSGYGASRLKKKNNH